MTDVERKAEQAAIELLSMTGWLKWHDYFISAKEIYNAKLVDIDDPAFPYRDYRRFMWYEDKAPHLYPVCVSEHVFYGDRYITLENEFREEQNLPAASYGTTWRLWTEEPSQAQREARPW